MDYSAVRHSSKVNSSIISRSMLSQINRTMSKEESFHRKLKNLIEKNAILQKKIKDYELGIKDERTVIIYQMNELNKAVGTKLGLFSDYSLTQEMFHNEIVAHENLKDLMEKFEEIQKQELMMRKIKNNLDDMYESYMKHKESLQVTNSEFQLIHEECLQNLKNQIQQRRVEIMNAEEEHQDYLQKIEELRDEMEMFKNQETPLKQEEQYLKKEIQKYEKEVQQKSKVFDKMSELTEIVIDKKNRYKVYDQISENKKVLGDLINRNRKKEMELKELKLNKC